MSTVCSKISPCTELTSSPGLSCNIDQDLLAISGVEGGESEIEVSRNADNDNNNNNNMYTEVRWVAEADTGLVKISDIKRESPAVRYLGQDGRHTLNVSQS